MSQSYQSFASITPSQSNDAYILGLLETTRNGLAAITSADELLIVDRQDLLSTQTTRFGGVPNGVNCLVLGDAHDQSLLCSGTDGTVATFDVRSQNRVGQFQIDRAVSAIASKGFKIAVGTEFINHQAVVSLWDSRQNKRIWQNAENNDEITALKFHPSRENIVLAGGDDGLVSLFDTNVLEEEDSLVQVINHSPIHKAGFLGETRIYALSSDQNFAVYPVSTSGDDEDPAPTLIGDLRPIVPCQYAIDVLVSGGDYVVAAGSNIESSRLDLVKLEDATTLTAQPWLDSTSKHTLEPAHGEEVIRAIVIDDQTGVIFTAGEDGVIRASRRSPQQLDVERRTSKQSKHKKSLDGRFKPY